MCDRVKTWESGVERRGQESISGGNLVQHMQNEQSYPEGQIGVAVAQQRSLTMCSTRQTSDQVRLRAGRCDIGVSLLFLRAMWGALKVISRGAWVAQLAERPTSAQVMISWFVSSSPVSGSVLTAQNLEPTLDSVSSSLSAPPPLILCLSLSQK